MAKIDILIFNFNEGLVDITIESLRKNMPDWNYKVIDVVAKHRTLFYAYTYSKKIKKPILAVNEGLLLNIKEEDIPDSVSNHPMVVSREAVHSRKGKYLKEYEEVGENVIGRIDLSIFFLNYENFDFYPMRNTGVLSKITTGYMPRSMNHKPDILFKTTQNPYSCLKYGLDGMNASVLNYNKLMFTQKLKMNELMAYSLEKFSPYLRHISNNFARSNMTNHVSKIRKNSIHKLRYRFNQVPKSRFITSW